MINPVGNKDDGGNNWETVWMSIVIVSFFAILRAITAWLGVE
jgi:hypothetical protein